MHVHMHICVCMTRHVSIAHDMHLIVFVCLLLERLGASAEENLAQQHAGQDESASKGWRHEGALRCLHSNSAQGESMHDRCTRHPNRIAIQAHHRPSQQVAHTLAHASPAVSRSAAFGAASPALPLKDKAAAMSVCDVGGRRVWARMAWPYGFMDAKRSVQSV